MDVYKGPADPTQAKNSTANTVILGTQPNPMGVNPQRLGVEVLTWDSLGAGGRRLEHCRESVEAMGQGGDLLGME